MKKSERLLFFTGELDSLYFDNQLSGYEIDKTYSKNKDEFSQLSTDEKYDILIFNNTGNELIPGNIIQSLTGAKNLYTPVIIICGKDDVEVMNQCLRHQFDFIVFPFYGIEFRARIKLAVKSKETEITIHKSLLQYRAMFEEFPAGVLQTDENGNFYRYNNHLLKILEMKDPDFSGLSFFQLCHPDDYLIQRQNLDRLLRKEIDEAEFEIRIINNNGKTIVCNVRVKAIWLGKDDFGSFIYTLERLDN
ncbi:MAG TPA: PAS domain-containing protein [Bacteroidales bacterium]|nr:PAS domain-containing protein [Bacteroidales bacterium]